jgi:hypothetical protein
VKLNKTITALTAGLAISLLVNIFVICNLLSFKSSARDVIAAAREGLSILSSEPFTADIRVNQVIPLELEVPINQTINVPIDTTYYLDTVIHTTVNLPLIGPQRIAVPIKEEIPLKLDLNIPVQLIIPLSIEYHLDEVLPIQVSLPPETLEAMEQTLLNIEAGLK